MMRETSPTLSFHLHDPEATLQFGTVLGDVLRSTTAHPAAVMVLLSGELGAGKTSVSRGIAAGLGVNEDAVASPTFTIRMDHLGATRPFVHIDAWRISEDDLEQIGFDELLTSNAVVAIEWPERIASRLPTRHLRLALEYAEPVQTQAGHADDPSRIVTISCHGMDTREVARLTEALTLLVRAPRRRDAHCPTCGKPTPASEHGAAGAVNEADSGGVAPFCSPRCQLADLGDWLFMRHRIAGSATPEFDE